MTNHASSSAPPPEEIPFGAEVVRKLIHLVALVVPLGMALLGKAWAVTLLVPAALLAIAADVWRVRSIWFAEQIHRIFGPLMRPEEVPPVGGPVHLNGATWVLVTAALLSIVFPVRLGASAFAMFMISDAAAALVGRRFGTHRWPGSRRTVEGSLAFVAVGLVVVAVLPGIIFWTGAVSVVAGAIAEAAPRPLNDNIRVPLVAAAVLYLLERFALNLSPVLLFGG